jgi:hypothetical protein
LRISCISGLGGVVESGRVALLNGSTLLVARDVLGGASIPGGGSTSASQVMSWEATEVPATRVDASVLVRDTSGDLHRLEQSNLVVR